MPKPLKDWTLAEVKAECSNRKECSGCPFEKNSPYEYRPCILASVPFTYKLDKEEKTN